MDPNETLANALLAMWSGSLEDAEDALADLQRWTQLGGFPPNIGTVRRLVNERLMHRADAD